MHENLSKRTTKDIEIETRKNTEVSDYFNIEIKRTEKSEFFIYFNKPKITFFIQ
ncbi:hypothetical protein DESAMIL20_15 [Desulfurella amilsii]|uniref:Uncharacterized protein n=1 Tax=Desulfurella amilsii TaxID=1562698 RepID=A0A1X4XZD7_9BACT|nr:hypothetical protein DESAMIL20_15 [Desulfurella amilsii]